NSSICAERVAKATVERSLSRAPTLRARHRRELAITTEVANGTVGRTGRARHCRKLPVTAEVANGAVHRTVGRLRSLDWAGLAPCVRGFVPRGRTRNGSPALGLAVLPTFPRTDSGIVDLLLRPGIDAAMVPEQGQELGSHHRAIRRIELRELFR